MPKEDLVIRTSLDNKRVVLRGSPSNPLTGARLLLVLPLQEGHHHLKVGRERVIKGDLL